jgi:hypothetical protein
MTDESFFTALNDCLQSPSYTVEHYTARDNSCRLRVSMQEMCRCLDQQNNAAVLHPMVEFLCNLISPHVDHIIETLAAHVEQLQKEFAESEGAQSATSTVYNDTSKQIAQLMNAYMLYRLGTDEQKNNAEFISDWEPQGGFKFAVNNVPDSPIMLSSAISANDEYIAVAPQISKTLSVFSSGIYQCVFHSDDNDQEPGSDTDDPDVHDPDVHDSDVHGSREE